jgi:hypothetical protein
MKKILVNMLFISLIFGGVAVSYMSPNRKKQPEQTISKSTLNFKELIPDTFSKSAIFRLEDYMVWCADMVRTTDGTCHLFFSHWPKHLGHRAWVTHSMIGYATSDKPEGPYRYQGIALGYRNQTDWDGTMAHNPSIIEFNGKYYLYYTGTHGPGDWRPDRSIDDENEIWQYRMNQRVGVAVADHPAGPWQRFDKPLLDVPEYGSGIVATPCAMVSPENKVYLYFKTQIPGNGKFGGGVFHYPSISDSPIGPFKKIDKPMINKNEIFPGKFFNFHVDDHEEWFQNDRYYAIVKDHDAPYLTQYGKILHLLESKDGITWIRSANSFVKDRKIIWDDGHVQYFTRLEMPKIYLDNGKPKVLFLSALPDDDPEEHSFNVAVPLESQ